MDPPPRGSDALVGMQPGRAADRHDIQRGVRQELVHRVVDARAVGLGECTRALAVRPLEGDHLDVWNSGSGTGVGAADVAPSDDADSHVSVPRRPQTSCVRR